MNASTISDSLREFRAAIALERILSRTTLRWLQHCGFLLFLCGTATAAFLYYLPTVAPTITEYRNIFAGVGVFGLAIWLDTLLTTLYHNSFYYRGVGQTIGQHDDPITGLTYDAAAALERRPYDVAAAFVLSPLGQSALLRSNIGLPVIQAYLASARRTIHADMLLLPPNEQLSLIGVGKYLLAHDPSFATFLKEQGVRGETFLGAVRWVVGTHHAEKNRARYWSRDQLSKVTGIGRELAYGVAYTLQSFSRDIRTSAVFSTLTRDSAYAAEKLVEIEVALAGQKASNVLLIGEAGVGKMDLLMEVARRMRTGEALDALVGEHVYVLDTNRLFAVHQDKAAFEQTFLHLLTEATEAGHVIIVIEHLHTFIQEAAALGVFIPELLDEYLALPDIHIIATDTPDSYHTHLETNGSFMRRFTEVVIETPNLEATTRVLERVALQQEAKHSCLITYQALQAVSEAADRYIVDGVMPDKAITLLLQVIAAATQAETAVITDELVYQTVSEQTGMPAGPIEEAERDQLLHLEDNLHRLVVGQQRALDAIAKTMRRARTGIQASDKPIGSFLFLGPTGVGKTETAKALATVFFGGEQNLRRLDMSEYSGDDAVTQLIGANDRTGTLPTLLREHPYSVMLLDEFEKAAQPVHDVFLQILDEGKFTDGRGEVINARNCIIIATSNAGSRLILETVQSRQTLRHLNGAIIDHVIETGVYRPELINRFDNTIIFEPLTVAEQRQVAQLLLNGLHARIESQGYTLSLAPDLIDLLVEQGYHPEFGARPMQRVIQDVIEEAIAQQIISGAVQKGQTITLTRTDVTAAV